MPTPTSTLDIRLKRAYEAPADSDGTRVLIDRLWPRGVSKATARIDHWFREVAPSTALRRWFGHDPERWQEFQRRYRDELRGQDEILGHLGALAAQGPLTLVYGARDVEHNDAVVLRQLLLGAVARAPLRGTRPGAPTRRRRASRVRTTAARPAGKSAKARSAVRARARTPRKRR